MANFYILTLFLIIGGAAADYILTIKLAAFHNPGQVLVTGDCCVDPPANQTFCIAPCNTTLKICVHEGGFDPANSNCPGTKLIVGAQGSGEWRTVFPGAWTGPPQLYITVIHDQTASSQPLSPSSPVIGNLIDIITIDQLSLSPSEPPTPPTNYTGQFNVASAEFSFSVDCTFEFFGPTCENFCPLGRNDSLGRYQCDGNGSRACIEGYADLSSNCTTCIPQEGCSDVGGFCNFPGECICRTGYHGPTCSENNTLSITTISPMPSPSTPPLSLSQSNNDITRQLQPPSIVPTSPSAVGPPPTMDVVSLASTSSQITSIISLLPSSQTTPVVMTTATQILIRTSTFTTYPTTTPTPISMLPPTPSSMSPPVTPPVASNQPIAEPIGIVLGSLLGSLLLIIVTSLTILFLVSLSCTCWRRRKSYNVKKEAKELYTATGNHQESNILINRSITNNQNQESHSDLGRSLEDLTTETLYNPTYSTFIEDNGALTQETVADQEIGADIQSSVGMSPHSEDNLVQINGSIDEQFQEVNYMEMSLGDNLLGSIKQSLSPAGGQGIESLSINNSNLDNIDLGSDYAPSFIYSDIDFMEEDCSTFKPPSLSQDSNLSTHKL